MTKKIDFEKEWERLVEYITYSFRGKVSDVELMSALEYNPSSWKVWKPKFVEQANVENLYKYDDEGNIISSSFVEYHKKKKLWNIKKCDDNKIHVRLKAVYS